MDNRRARVYILLFFSMLFWAISYIWSKIVFTLYSPITTIFLRLVIASLIFLVYGKLSGKLQRIRRGDRKFLFLLSFLQPFLYFLGENLGLYHLTPTVVAIIISTIPLFVALAETLVFRVRLHGFQYGGILLSIGGVAMVLAREPGSGEDQIAWGGIVFLALAVFAAVTYSITVLRISNRYSSFTLISYQNLVGILYFLPAFLILDGTRFLHTEVTVKVAASLICLAVFSSSLAFIFFVKGMKTIGITKASVFGNMIPAFTALFSFLWLGERLSLLNVGGILLVIAGVVTTQRRPRSMPLPQQQ